MKPYLSHPQGLSRNNGTNGEAQIFTGCQTRRRWHIRGLSLVELLVTTGIISVLVALTLPMAMAGREAIRRVHCFSNLRQLGVAFNLYSLSNYSAYPHEDAGTGGEYPAGCCWFDVLDPYLTGENLSQVKQCPASMAEARCHSYKMNSLLEDEETPFYRSGMNSKEAKTILLFDGRVDNRGTQTQTKGSWPSASARHSGFTHLLFLDGRTERFRPALTTSGGWADAGPFVWDWRE